MGIPISLNMKLEQIIDKCIVKVVKGNSSEIKSQGTWMHQELALKFAAWLSPKFEVWVFQQIKTLLKTGSVSLQNTQSSDMADLKQYFKEELAKNTLELIKN